ncbi:MAG: glycosyltransferase family 39 protein [Anaerolineae bacterium]|nr:glycosyltransferase family 39 protein [Anaerolineae bacterium]
MKIHPMRLVYALLGAILTTVTWFGTSGNNINGITFIIWILSAAAWSMTFAPNINLMDWVIHKIDSFRRIHWRGVAPVAMMLLLIIGIGGYFRFHNLRDLPREMTDDHVEKILDAALVRNGLRPIFFANNGGREPFQMYAIALASRLPSLGIDHFTIKVVAATESLLTIPLIFWMAYELLEGETRRRRLLVALVAAALLATSYWHVAITRQALRIALTPLVASLLLIYLSRALRRNNRADFIKTGLILGFGLYTYQAVRMLPIVIVIAVGITVYFVAQNWKARFRYVLNLIVLVWIAFVAFIPMFHYSVEFPELFWRRTTGRLLGDDVIEETLDDGTIVMREASVQERVEAFRDNVPQLMSNIRNVLLMFNWKGDVAAISGVPNRPTMDTMSGTLFIVGLAAWVALMIRRRDVAMWMIPIFIFIMLLPSALSIAFPVENPSHTRTSGAMVGVYLIAALPLALLVEALLILSRKRLAKVASFGLCTLVIFGVYSANAHTYFDVYPQVYADSFDPYTEPGAYLRGFAISGGSYGNAFMIGYQHWWSHRAIGLAGGLETLWPNGIVAREDIPRILRDHANRSDQFVFDANRDILFFYSPEDEETGNYLSELFPDGYASLERTYAQNNDYMVYRIPALGESGFADWLIENLAD